VLLFLQRNLVWMLLALALSATLWTVVTTQQNPDVVDVFPSIPVELRNIPGGMTVRNEPPPVSITVIGPADVIPTLRAAKFQATVDLSRGAPGLQDLPVEVHSIDGRVKVQDISPGKASILLEPIRRKEVPARAKVVGERPLGFNVRAPKMTPDLVAVSGPQSMVEQVVAAVADVSMTGVTNSINQVYRVTPQNAAGERVDRITITPENVLIEMPVEQERAFKSVPVSVELRGAPAPGYQVVGLRVDPVAITVEGEPRAIESIQFAQTAPVNVDSAAGDLSVNAELEMPAGVRSARTQPIVVRVFVAPIEGTKVVEIAPTIQNVGDSLRTQVNPTTIRLTVVGPMPILSSLGPRELRVVVDAAGLTPGLHQLRPRVDVPSPVRLQAAQPDRVDLTLIAPPTPTPSPTPVVTRTPAP
jgi:YbbR domain-containing protein